MADDITGDGNVARRRSRVPLPPSELIHRPLLKWPSDASELTGIPAGLLENRQRVGDAPRLTRIGRQTFVRPRDLNDWIDQHVEDSPTPKNKRAGGVVTRPARKDCDANQIIPTSAAE